MAAPLRNGFAEHVIQAAESVLKRNGSVGPLELFQELRWLHPAHVESWRKGNEHYPTLEKCIHIGPAKFEKALQHFQAWAKQHGLRSIEAAYTRRSPRGIEPLQVTIDGNPQREQFYQTHYAPADLPQNKASRLAAKLNKPPDIVVFEKSGEVGKCSECGAELADGDHLCLEKSQPLCLTCADLDHLVFLPSGDTAMSRRARKHSPLSAVVVRFNRRRKRYERQGLLVTSDALTQAEEQCAADAPERAAARTLAAVARIENDLEFIGAMTKAILDQFPACEPSTARRIAEHAGERSSGRVGRSAAGRDLDPRAIELAVIAHIRHEHTNYDQLLMKGVARMDARALIRDRIQEILAGWSGSKNLGIK
ncbi:MAG: DUF2293 domain-containing protein [Verrucomicrobiota bacterium]